MNLAHTLGEAIAHGVGVERSFLCPVHADSRPSASVNTLLNVWVCYTCGARGKVSGEALLGEIDFGVLRRHIHKTLAEEKIYSEAWLNQFDAGPTHEYWASRFKPETIAHFRLGYDVETNRAVYPLRDPYGRILGTVGRKLSDEDPHPAKYKYPMGVDVGKLLFGYDGVPRDTVVLVEGAADAMAMWEVGVPALGIYGSRLSTDQIVLIERLMPSRIITMFDRDDAGWQAYLRAKGMIRRYPVGRAVWPRAWGKDVDEVSEELRRNLLDRVEYGREGTVGSSTCESPKTQKTPAQTLTSLSPVSSSLSSTLPAPRKTTKLRDSA